MEYFAPIESNHYHYRMFQFFWILFGISFTIGGVNFLFVKDWNNAWFFLLGGFTSVGVIVYYSTKLSLVTVSHKGIVLHNKKGKVIAWSDIYMIEIKHFMIDHCIRVHTKDGEFNIQPDKPKGFDFNDAFQPEKAYLRSKMWQKINKIIRTK